MFNDNKKASREIPAKSLAEAEAYFENWLKTAVLEEDDLLFQSLPEDAKEKIRQNREETKKSKKAMTTKIKIICVCIVCILLLIVQLCAFTPYVRYETYISSQNVPHSVVIERGYAAINEIGYEPLSYGKIFETEEIDYLHAFIQFGLTIGTAVFLCIWIYKKDKTSPKKILSKSELPKKIEHLEKENQLLKTYIRNGAAVLTPPTLDIDSLTFATGEQQESVMAEYNKQMLQYAHQKVIREYVCAYLGIIDDIVDTPCDEELDEIMKAEPLSEKEQQLLFEEMSTTSNTEETYYLMESANGTLVRIPASKLSEWIKQQEGQNRI